MALFSAFDLLLTFHSSEKRDAARRVGCSGWPCGGISRQDAEDKRPMDGLEASPKGQPEHRIIRFQYLTPSTTSSFKLPLR